MQHNYAGSPQVVRLSHDIPMLITQVQAIDRHVTGPMVVQLDARIDQLPFAWSEARLLNRHSPTRSRLWLVVRRPSRVDMVYADDVTAIRLPSDLHMGDLLAIPGRSSAAVSAFRAELS